MVAKIVKEKGFKGVINYVLDKAKQTELITADGVTPEKSRIHYTKFHCSIRIESESIQTGRTYLA